MCIDCDNMSGVDNCFQNQPTFFEFKKKFLIDSIQDLFLLFEITTSEFYDTVHSCEYEVKQATTVFSSVRFDGGKVFTTYRGGTTGTLCPIFEGDVTSEPLARRYRCDGQRAFSPSCANGKSAVRFGRSVFKV